MVKLAAVEGAAVPTPTVPYSQAVTVDVAEPARLIFVSGQGPVDERGATVGGDDPAAQARQVFANIQSLLQAAGAALSDVVELNIYVRDIAYRAALIEVRQALLRPPYPATTMVAISGLAFPDWLLEISATAVVPAGERAAPAAAAPAPG